MKQSGIKPDIATFSILWNARKKQNKGSINGMMELMKNEGISSDIYIFNASNHFYGIKYNFFESN